MLGFAFLLSSARCCLRTDRRIRQRDAKGMRHFRVAHDFQGEEAVELSVRKGELVFAAESIVQDGWIKVECVADARRCGFVPLSYLKEVSEEEAPQEHKRSNRSNSPQQPHQVRTPSPRSQPAGAGDLSPSPVAVPEANNGSHWREGARARGEAAPEYGEQIATASARSSRSPRDRSATTPQGDAARRVSHTSERDQGGGPASLTTNAPLTPARASTGGALVDRGLLSNPNTVVEAFMKNEVYFKQLMQRRADALAQMQGGFDEVLHEVSACKDRNSALARKLRELDQVIEKERRRWTERVEEEKAFVGRSLTYVPGSVLGLTARSTPRRQSSGSRQPSPASGRRSTAATLSAGGLPSAY